MKDPGADRVVRLAESMNDEALARHLMTERDLVDHFRRNLTEHRKFVAIYEAEVDRREFNRRRTK